MIKPKSCRPRHTGLWDGYASPTIRLCKAEKFFGVLDRWLLRGGGCTRRFNCTGHSLKHISHFQTAVIPFFTLHTILVAVFSLNFSSAGKGRFMAGKAQDMCQRRTFRGGGGGGGGDSRVRDMARPLLRNFGATFSET